MRTCQINSSKSRITRSGRSRNCADENWNTRKKRSSFGKLTRKRPRKKKRIGEERIFNWLICKNQPRTKKDCSTQSHASLVARPWPLKLSATSYLMCRRCQMITLTIKCRALLPRSQTRHTVIHFLPIPAVYTVRIRWDKS